MTVKVKSGMSLTQAIKASALFPEMAVDLIAVGQESGKLEKGLYPLAAYGERSSQGLAQTFVAMLLPMFQMNMIIN